MLAPFVVSCQINTQGKSNNFQYYDFPEITNLGLNKTLSMLQQTTSAKAAIHIGPYFHVVYVITCAFHSTCIPFSGGPSSAFELLKAKSNDNDGLTLINTLLNVIEFVSDDEWTIFAMIMYL